MVLVGDSNVFLKKLKSLDDQLCAIEATAETVAGDLKASSRVRSSEWEGGGGNRLMPRAEI